MLRAHGPIWRPWQAPRIEPFEPFLRFGELSGGELDALRRGLELLGASKDEVQPEYLEPPRAGYAQAVRKEPTRCGSCRGYSVYAQEDVRCRNP